MEAVAKRFAQYFASDPVRGRPFRYHSLCSRCGCRALVNLGIGAPKINWSAIGETPSPYRGTGR